MTCAAVLKASLWTRIAPSTERSASRLCGSVRSAVAIVSGIAMWETRKERSLAENRKSQTPNPKPQIKKFVSWDLELGIWDLPLSALAFLDDLHLQWRRHGAMQLQRHVVLTDRLDRFGQGQLTPIDLEALRLEELCDVGGGDRPIQLLGVAYAARDGNVESQQP